MGGNFTGLVKKNINRCSNPAFRIGFSPNPPDNIRGNKPVEIVISDNRALCTRCRRNVARTGNLAELRELPAGHVYRQTIEDFVNESP